MPAFSVHLQDSTVGKVGGIAEAVVRGSSIPGVNHMDVAVAYASAAGVDILEGYLATVAGWREWRKRFLISIDFGTTEPAVFERIGRIPNAEVRIPRGAEVLRRPGLVPRVPFHSKAWTFYRAAGRGPAGLVIGSGNLTRSGMSTGGEMAVALTTLSPSAWPAAWQQTFDWFETVWDGADPAGDLAPAYAEIVRAAPGFGSPPEDSTEAARQVRARPVPPDLPGRLQEADALFVRVDRVTRNRGRDRPGNQIDVPLRTSRFFHLQPRETVGIVGEVALRVPGFPAVVRNVRVGANSMDKIDLPLPESVGIDTYDDSYLIFRRTRGRHEGAALFELEITDEPGLRDVRAPASHSFAWRMHGGREWGLVFD
ncbi:hypothetical protein [Paractinoplanes brasiliensis]|uniref:HKD family nuclease n=1 Tax=Paractinoplanes brasiliensis TaxID=52695 RepID=A0A4R6JC97_9ACTN|nr:hypothetical protein [Actinoplanes brasiliensis]TDO32541.1 hypothetical protein C8E87_8006 [Actinoplanes brasiliensis]GID27583.1 hypothetical protein Abr02nite_25660 [Actinoplanes brasiliensis]